MINTGKIEGNLYQKSGDNIGIYHQFYENITIPKEFRRNTESRNDRFFTSSSESFASGNGVSLTTETLNPEAENKNRLGSIENAGTIKGKADIVGAKGIHDLSLSIKAAANGIVAYSKIAKEGQSDIQSSNRISDIHNSGIISGSLSAKGGKAITEGDSIPDKELKLAIHDTVKNIGANPNSEFKPSALSNKFQAPTSTNINIIASGNGISAYSGAAFFNAQETEELREGSRLGHIDNTGVISGYAHVLHGIDSRKHRYAPINFWGIGSGIATDGGVLSDINNKGIISGNHAAIFAKGIYNDGYSLNNPIYDSGYKAKVNNYGLLAGTMILGNFKGEPEKGQHIKQVFRYFEKDNDPALNNLGMLVYLKKGVFAHSESKKKNGIISPDTIYNDNPETIDKIVIGKGGKYTDKKGNIYNIINGPILSSNNAEYHSRESVISNSIINGIGLEKGALTTQDNIKISKTIINGFANGLYIEGNNTELNDTTINTNGFDIKLNNNQYQKPYAIKGSDGANKLSLLGKSTINGDINLQDGDDTLTIDNNVKFNGTSIDMDKGADIIRFGDLNNVQNSLIKVNYNIKNSESIEINTPTKIYTDAIISGIDKLVLNDKLIYQIDKIGNEYTHALLDKNRTTDITIEGNNKGEFIVDLNDAERNVDFGGYHLVDNGHVAYKSLNTLQNVALIDGNLVVTTKKAEVLKDNTPKSEEMPKADVVAKSDDMVKQDNNSSTFKTGYIDAYNSYTQSWKTTGVNPLKNSASTKDKSEEAAILAVNDYLNKTVNKNIYGKVPSILLNNISIYNSVVVNKNKPLLNKGEVLVNPEVPYKKANNISEIGKEENTVTLLNIDYGLTDKSTIGFAIGKGNHKYSEENNGRFSGKSTYFNGHLVHAITDHLSLNTGVFYSKWNLDANRIIDNNYDRNVFNSKFSPVASGVYSQAKYTFDLGKYISISPKVGVQYNRLKFNIHEQGNGGLTINENSYANYEAKLGSDFAVSLPVSNGNITGKLYVDYTKPYNARNIKARFSEGNAFELATDKGAYLSTGMSLEYNFKGVFSIDLGMNKEFKKSINSFKVNSGMIFKF